MSHSARVALSSGPIITSPQEQEVGLTGNQAMVTCKADTSALEVTVEWSFGGQKIVSGSHGQ